MNFYEDDIVHRMYEIAVNYPEDASQDHISSNSEYIVNLTFSAVRQNILNWYSFRKDADLLEIGADMGAITGMLCDRVKSVTAVEMNGSKADVIRARYPDRKNLCVVNDSISTWKCDKKFDYIVFIGILEYAGTLYNSFNPYESFLSDVSTYLKEDGVLLFAIENRFGLKYWLGASEDHIMKPFVGIDGYKGPKTVKTFSESELINMLDNVGLTDHRTYYVYPDHRFPEEIYTKDYKPNYSDLKKVHFTYSPNSTLYADERELYKNVIDNDAWRFMANSFLIEAGKLKLPEKHVIYVSSKGERKRQYRVSTIIYSDNEVAIVPVNDLSVEHIEQIYHNTEKLRGRGVRILPIERKGVCLYCDYCEMRSAQSKFEEILADNDRDKLGEFIDKYRTAVFKSSEESVSGNAIDELEEDYKDIECGSILKEGYVEMTPQNAFYDDDFIFYDQEWCFSDIPAEYIIYLGLKNAYFHTDAVTEISFDWILDYLNIERRKIALYDKLGEYIWSKVLYRYNDLYGEDSCCNEYSENLRIENAMAQRDKVINDLKKEYKDKEETLNSILASKGWKIVSTPGKLFEEHNKRRSERTEKHSRINRYVTAMFNKTNIRFVINSFKCGGIKQVRSEIHAFEKRINNERGQMAIRIPDLYPMLSVQSIDHYIKLEFKQMDCPDVSIVIPVYNQFEYTYNCLRSILDRSGDIRYEIIIADDMSDDLTTLLSSITENINIIRNNKNQGFLLNCNHAARYAKGKYIVFLNNDTQVQDNWLQPLVRLIENDDKIGVVGSKLIYPDGRLQEAGAIVWKDGSAWNYGNGQSPEEPEYNYVREVDYISGAAVMIRKELWDKIGGFDERYVPAYYEDTDFAFEVRRHGYKVIYQPQSVVVHFEGISNGTDDSVGIKRYQRNNQDKFKDKWNDLLSAQKENGQDVFVAKDRSIAKKHILVVDHYVPHYDMDAGGRCTFMYIKLFVRSGMQVTFIGDSYNIQEPYTSVLNQMGVEVLYGNYYLNNWRQWLKDNGRYFDYIYLQRPHISVKYIDIVKKYSDAKIFYFAHDLHFLRTMREYEITGNRECKEQVQKWKKMEYELFSKADVGHVVGYYEQEIIQKAIPDTIIRNIPLYIYDKSPEGIEKGFSKRKDILSVGGFGHPPNVDGILWFAKDIYPKVLERYPDMVWHIVGSDVPKEVQAHSSANIMIEGYVDDDVLEQLYHSCRIAIAPLRFGAGVKGKVVEACFYEVPVVTTEVGAEGLSMEEGAIVVADDMAQEIISLYEDYDRLCRISDRGRAFISNHFSVEEALRVISLDMDIQNKPNKDAHYIFDTPELISDKGIRENKEIMVSIVMPVYNAMPYLRDAISDILGQTYKNFELICVDDGSVDESVRVLEYFAKRDNRIRVISQTNQGPSVARNRGMDRARGKYVWVADADDRFEEFLLEKTVARLETTGCDVVCFDAGFFDSESEYILSSEWITHRDELPDKQVFSCDDCPNGILNIIASAPWNKVCKRDFLDANDIRFETVLLMDDTLYSSMVMLKAKRITFIDDKLLFYRNRTQGSISGEQNRQCNWRVTFRVLDNLLDILKQEGVYEKVWKSFAKYAANYVLWNEEIVNEDEFYDLISEVKNKRITEYRLNRLSKEDFCKVEQYNKIRLLIKRSEQEYLYNLMKELHDKARYLYHTRGELYTSMPDASDIYFRFPSIERGKRVAVFGEGSHAEQIHYLAGLSGKYKVWKRIMHHIEDFYGAEYDYIVIAENSLEKMIEIKQCISGLVDESIIRWV